MTATTRPDPVLRWDIFCQVIDNYGDIGVGWRLARNLAARGQPVRLWVDDASALDWMAPQGCPGVTVLPWTQPLPLQDLPPGDVLVEAFGCDIPSEFISAYAGWRQADRQQPVWLNLEYLSAEGYVERSHRLPSPLMSGPGRGLTKHFFYPGFTPRTGGLLREPDLLQRQARFERSAWLRQRGIEHRGEQLVSLFCYEPPALPGWLMQLAAQSQPSRLLVTPGRATAAVQAALAQLAAQQPAWNAPGKLTLSYLPALSQDDYDHLLWACDLNFVRGEDSLVRALWAAKPLVWQIYPQHDQAHHDKLEAFLDMLGAPAALRQFHQTWNGFDSAPLPALNLDAWAQTAAQTRARLLAQPDLVSQLLEFAASVRTSRPESPKNR
jgi:uncharacterized repeat protein (TIGR03837 family)